MTKFLQNGISRALAVVLVLASLSQAQSFRTLYNFTLGFDGGYPKAGVIQGPAGTLYGATAGAGAGGFGVVYELNTAGETVLHSFSGSDGAVPFAAVLRDGAGNLYGTTYSGGSSDYGTIFRIDTSGNETVLHDFTGGTSDGCYPLQGLIMDNAGSLYGTTYNCGSGGVNGTVFRLDSAGNFSVLHSFAGSPSDGANPSYGRLAMDKAGNLYGVTIYGGAHGYGALYRLNRSGTLTLLHSFANSTTDGCYPYGSVVQDLAGSLYGTTWRCGAHSDYGTIWKVSTNGKESILHNFAGGKSDGCYPYAGLVGDLKSGDAYGVTNECGANNWGALYELNASGRLTLLHSFDGSDGAFPIGEVMRTATGTLFGTTTDGGTYDAGTVWSYVPSP